MTAVDTPFYLFFGIMGLVAGGLIVWLMMAERAFEDPGVRGGPVDAVEAPLLVKALADDGLEVDEDTVLRLLELHTAYFDGRIYDTLAEAEDARLAAERAQRAAELHAHREAARLAAEAAQAAAGTRPARPRRRSRGANPEV